jgi:hypothetical protein
MKCLGISLGAVWPRWVWAVVCCSTCTANISTVPSQQQCRLNIYDRQAYHQAVEHQLSYLAAAVCLLSWAVLAAGLTPYCMGLC